MYYMCSMSCGCIGSQAAPRAPSMTTRPLSSPGPVIGFWRRRRRPRRFILLLGGRFFSLVLFVFWYQVHLLQGCQEDVLCITLLHV